MCTPRSGHSVIDRMNVVLLASLLGAATFILQVSTFKEHAEVRVSVWPPGSNVYLGECVLLQCTVEPRATLATSYQWCSSKGLPAAQNPRHLISGDRYFITGVTMEDADVYWCQAQYRHNKTTLKAAAPPLMLNVSGLLPPLLNLSPNTRHMFSEDSFTVQCPSSEADPSSWKLMHLFLNHTENDTSDSSSSDCVMKVTSENATQEDESPYKRTVASAAFTVQDPPLRGAASVDRNGGLYWCENANGRSNAVSITASYGAIIMKTPPSPVLTGDKVVLYCRYRTGNHNRATFFKNEEEINTYNSSNLEGEIMMTIENVTQEDEGFYKCASQDRKMQSARSWLSVRSDRGKLAPGDERPASSSGVGKWMIGSCGIFLLFVIPLTIWLVYHYRYKTFCKQDIPAVALPAMKQDVTEVQWDLPWMEMSSLLDKQL